MAVPNRLPRAPKMFPRMPMAAGTSTSRPGRRSRVWVMAPRVSPAARSPTDDTNSATRPWRVPATSAAMTARSRLVMRRPGRGRAGSRGMVDRSPVALVALVRIDEAVADARLGDESGAGGVVAQLLAELAGVHAQVLRLGPVLGPPHLLQDRPVGEHPPRPPAEQGEEGELLRGQVHRPLAHRHGVAGGGGGGGGPPPR